MSKISAFYLLGHLSVSALSYAQVPQDVNIDIDLSHRLFDSRDSMQNLLSDIDTRYGETADLLYKIQIKIEQKRSSLDDLSMEMLRYENDIDMLGIELG